MTKGTGTDIPLILLSQGNTGLSNVNTELSDQLVIQYRPQYVQDPDDADKLFGGFDCEGNRIEVAKVASGTQDYNIIVQRYFYVKIPKLATNRMLRLLLLVMQVITPILALQQQSQVLMTRVKLF